LRKRWPSKRIIAYAALLALSLAVATIAGWTRAAIRINNAAYDFHFSAYPPRDWTPASMILAVDEATFRNTPGGTRRIRTILAEGLELLAAANPRAVAVDVTLPDSGDPGEDARLARAMRRIHNLVLPCDIAANRWEDPLPIFRSAAAALGHIHADRNRYDNVSRMLPLEQTAPGMRRWALALEAFRLARGGGPVLESPDDIEVGGLLIPAARRNSERPLYIRYRPSGIPVLSLDALRRDPPLAASARDKVVFFGVTALTYAMDRLKDPMGYDMPGVEIHAHAFETLSQGKFLTPASNLTVLAAGFALAASAGLIFAFFSGWAAYTMAGALLIAAHVFPGIAFQKGVIFPYFTAVSSAWLPVVAAAAFQYFVVRRELRKTESDKARYQQAIHFVTHEMRTPLTAIQGSSELISRYNLKDDKRRQIADMINSESKRLARMIQTFLNVERLSQGQMELKLAPFAAREVIDSCIQRATPLAERKQIRIYTDELCSDELLGDRELMEYAIYNLLTNAIKYSPAEREVRVAARREGERVRIVVRDQGIGMNAKELRNVFKKFYRTKSAEASGEAGTGIGLSIVEQIVTHHRGRVEVDSAPGQGSTFAIVLPAHAGARVAGAVKDAI
jgi:signal transduction histidine kinase